MLFNDFGRYTYNSETGAEISRSFTEYFPVWPVGALDPLYLVVGGELTTRQICPVGYCKLVSSKSFYVAFAAFPTYAYEADYHGVILDVNFNVIRKIRNVTEYGGYFYPNIHKHIIISEDGTKCCVAVLNISFDVFTIAMYDLNSTGEYLDPVWTKTINSTDTYFQIHSINFDNNSKYVVVSFYNGGIRILSSIDGSEFNIGENGQFSNTNSYNIIFHPLNNDMVVCGSPKTIVLKNWESLLSDGPSVGTFNKVEFSDRGLKNGSFNTDGSVFAGLTLSDDALLFN